MSIIDVTDLPTSAQSADLVDVMVAGANATAARVAPCLVATDPEPTDEQLAEARLVLIGAVLRWTQAGSGAFQQQTAGPFSVSTDTRQRTGFKMWPSEIEQLQTICGGSESAAFAVDTAPRVSSIHSEACSLVFGANWCSCGADIAGYPIVGV